MLDDEAVAEPGVVDAADADALTGRGDAEEGAGMRPGPLEAERDQFALRDHRLRLDARVRESGAHVAEHDRDEPIGPVDVPQGAVRDEVPGQEGAHALLVARVDRAYQCRHHGLRGWHRGDPATSVASPAVATEVLESLRRGERWVNYAPGQPLDFVAGQHPATEEQLAGELGRLYDAGFRGMITNSVEFGLEHAPRIAKELGFEHVVAKLWWQDDDQLVREQANLDAAADHVDAVCVGNEIIQKGIADEDRLAREVGAARERWGLPVTTGFQTPDWMTHPGLATEIGDFSFLNVHPWWAMHRKDPLAAAAWVREAYDLVAATPERPADRVLFVQETSFPSERSCQESTPGATPENQKRFCAALLETGVPSPGSSRPTCRCTVARRRSAGSAASGTRTGSRSR